MSCRKTVTENKLAANRLNAMRSTGPRTERGKNTSRFNALKDGLFARHVVIPVCDGEGSEEQFAWLLADVQKEFQPESPLEDFYVAEIVECMWRLRRAIRAEQGSVRNSVVWEGEPPNACMGAQPYVKALFTVEKAKGEIMTTGTLSPVSYKAVLSILGITNPPTEPKIDDKFLPLLEWMKNMANNSAAGWISCEEQIREDYYAMHALPSELDMNKILQYEKAAQKKFDWALQRLLESQQRRRKAQVPATV